jgi:hypothetical protein
MGLPQEQYDFTDEQLEVAEEAFRDFTDFCKKYLVIEDIEGNHTPLIPNRPQRRFINTIMEQWRRTGRIRVIIAKARKMGFSTIITAFIFWRLYTQACMTETGELTFGNIGDKGIGAIAGTHHEDTNEVLVEMFKLFHNNLPEKMQPTVEFSNATGMGYTNLNAAYKVRAASNAQKVGRGPTVQMIHVSEIAHIDNAGELPKSLFSAVGEVINSMIFLESTANGMDTFHYREYTKAEKKEPGCKYVAFFAAWWEDDRYIEEPPDDFILTDEELDEKRRYNLTDAQMCWRRSKLATMDGSEKQRLAQFKQEYPGNAVEAFQYSKTDSYFDVDDLLDAINREPRKEHPNVAIVAAFDPTAKGKDRDVFGMRCGSHIYGIEKKTDFGKDFHARLRYLQDKLDDKTLGIDMLFIDVGQGYQLISELDRLGYNDDGLRVEGVDFGTAADNDKKARLKRDEMFVDFNEALTDKIEHLSITIDEDIKAEYLKDLTATGYKRDDKKRPKMESKESIKKRTGFSTDFSDMTVMLWAKKVKRRVPGHRTANDDYNYADQAKEGRLSL